MERNRAAEEPLVTGGTNFGMEKVLGGAMRTADVGGRRVPVYTDANGQTREVRNSKDIDRWRYSNRLGTPRFVKWKNPVTGETSMVPKRSVMRADPTTGEPLDIGTTEREAVKMVPLDPYDGPPSESRTGLPLKDGVLRGEVKLPFINPETGKRLSRIADLMTDKEDSPMTRGRVGGI